MDSKNMALYMKRRRKARRSKLKKILGGKCIICGTKEKLNFDHVDPSKKSFTISSRKLDGPWKELLKEIKKCQLLCEEHHKEKTSKERLAKHGTDSRYSHRRFPCRCKLCTVAHSKARKKWREKRKKLGLKVW